VKYLLDTNGVIGLLDGHPRLLRNVRARRTSDIGLSVIVAHELYFGAHRGGHAAFNLARIDALQFEPVPFDWDDARLAGAIRAQLATRGTPIGAYDLLIAAQARSRDVTLITHNVSEFSRVPGLRWEDWEA
jgi:tRNA(fMet)-specific endonuclease VapC